MGLTKCGRTGVQLLCLLAFSQLAAIEFQSRFELGRAVSCLRGRIRSGFRWVWKGCVVCGVQSGDWPRAG